MSLETYLRAAPKAELHLHLEGAIRPGTALDLARRNGVALPPEVERQLREGFSFPTFEQFIRTYVAITRCLRTVEDYAQIVAELGADLAAQGARYAEVTFSPSTHALVLGVPEAVFLEGLARGRRRAREDSGVELCWIFDIVARTTDPARFDDFTTSVAIEQRDNGVVALGLVGLDTDRGPDDFVRHFERARAAGLGTVPHAGELAGPAVVWSAVDVLGARRVAHGVRAIEDPALVDSLAEREVSLDICPTSNVRLGVFPSLASHPLRRLHEAGVRVTVSSDDPALFATTLGDEAASLATAFGFSPAEIEAVDGILLNAVRTAFLPGERRRAMEAEHRTELARLKAVHL